MRSFHLLCVVVALISSSESAVIPSDVSSQVSPDGSGAGEVPNRGNFGRDSNGDAVSTDDFGAGELSGRANNRRDPPSDYDEGDDDYVSELDFNRPGDEPQNSPDVVNDEGAVTQKNDEEDDSECCDEDEKDDGSNRPVDENDEDEMGIDSNRPIDVGEEDDEDFKVPTGVYFGEDRYKHRRPVYPHKHWTGFGLYPYLFKSPFFNMQQVSKYFQELEGALEQAFHQTLKQAMLLNGTDANTTEKEIDINGKKYIVQTSIIKKKDNQSSIYIEAVSTVPKRNQTKRIHS